MAQQANVWGRGRRPGRCRAPAAAAAQNSTASERTLACEPGKLGWPSRTAVPSHSSRPIRGKAAFPATGDENWPHRGGQGISQCLGQHHRCKPGTSAQGASGLMAAAYGWPDPGPHRQPR